MERGDVVERIKREDGKDVSKRILDPKLPTEREVEDHERFHIPYRNWCPVRVRAQANARWKRALCSASASLMSLATRVLPSMYLGAPGCFAVLSGGGSRGRLPIPEGIFLSTRHRHTCVALQLKAHTPCGVPLVPKTPSPPKTAGMGVPQERTAPRPLPRSKPGGLGRGCGSARIPGDGTHIPGR